MDWREQLARAAGTAHDPRVAPNGRVRGQKWLRIKRELNLPPDMTYAQWCAMLGPLPERVH